MKSKRKGLYHIACGTALSLYDRRDLLEKLFDGLLELWSSGEDDPLGLLPAKHRLSEFDVVHAISLPSHQCIRFMKQF